jgi:hypothetical protein
MARLISSNVGQFARFEITACSGSLGRNLAHDPALQRLGPFSPISNEMARNFIGERLGLPRSYQAVQRTKVLPCARSRPHLAAGSARKAMRTAIGPPLTRRVRESDTLLAQGAESL